MLHREKINEKLVHVSPPTPVHFDVQVSVSLRNGCVCVCVCVHVCVCVRERFC